MKLYFRLSLAPIVCLLVLSLVQTAHAQTSSLWTSSAPVLDTANASDTSSLEVGVKFTSDINGTITAIRFYKGSKNTGTHTVHLWSSSGALLASATSTNETASGWQTAVLPSPVPVTAGNIYVASYHTPGRYADKTSYFKTAYSNGTLHAPVGAGVFSYSQAVTFPTDVYQNSNYWVDIVFSSASQVLVNGQCGASNGQSLASIPVSNLCTSGTVSTVAGIGPWTWSCGGSNGGTNAGCSASYAAGTVNGTCGASNGATFSTPPTTGLCSIGTATTLSGSGPWTWGCVGGNGGATAKCSASLAASLVNGTCGASNGATFSTPPTTGFCTAGTVSTLSGSGPWTWGCVGSNGGTNATCSASLAALPVNGVCGPSNGGSTLSSPPAAGLCSIGTATTLSGSGPWTWGCVGSNGGTTSSCTSAKLLPVNGQCGPANSTVATSLPTSGLCSTGNASVVTGSSNVWTWSCDGSNGGTTSSCETITGTAAANTGLLIPLYEDPPGPDFDTILALKASYPNVPVYIILDPTSSGPGNKLLSNYAAEIPQLQAAGIIVVGYVDTVYTTRALATVEADVAKWKQFYPSINGIFFDEMSNTSSAVTYYSQANAYMHADGMTISFGNAGTQTPEIYFDNNAVDNVIIDEVSGYPNTSGMSNAGIGARNRKSIILYNVPFNAAELSLASQYSSLVWLTNASGNNPYNSIPSYLAQVFQALAVEQ